MNDPGLEDIIQDTATDVNNTLRERISSRDNVQRNSDRGPHSAGGRFPQKEQEKDAGYFAPQRWWFTSTAFPLAAGTFAPLANLFSVCALVQTWRVEISGGESEAQGQRITDPHWLVGVNAASLVLALIANLLLLLTFAHRVRYIIAQPLTISLWYLSSVLLIVPLALVPSLTPPSGVSQHALSQSYYYALLSTIMYATLSSLLLLHLIFCLPPFSKYPPSFATLTIPQRTLMLQAISFTLYLALGAGIFAAIEGWEYSDAVYWADYTLLTIGLGSDFPLQTSAGKGVLIPYAVGGILLIGIVIGSVRGLVLERAGIKMKHRHLTKERDRGIDQVKKKSPDEGLDSMETLKIEFEMMRKAAGRAEMMRKYNALGLSATIFIVIWFLGAMVFFFCESKQNWTYGTALYFSYTSLLTIGYGDLVPQSNAGKPFFVFWTLIAVPSVTIFISNIGDTVVTWVQKGTMWLGQRTILPERSLNDKDKDASSGRDRSRFLPLKKLRVVEKMVDEEEAREVDEGAVPDPAKAHGGTGVDNGIRGDLEKVGKAVETAEGERGQAGGMAARLAREIRYVSKDLGRRPPKEFEWEDWKRWIELLGESEESTSSGKEGLSSSDGLDDLRSPMTVGADRSNSNSSDGRRLSKGDNNTRSWIWLGDDGPLLSNDSEANWILGKLCDRLERVLIQESTNVGSLKMKR